MNKNTKISNVKYTCTRISRQKIMRITVHVSAVYLYTSTITLRPRNYLVTTECQ